MAELSGLAAVVTGGGSGIGLATARLLAARGARVAVLDLKPADEFLGLSADVTDDASVRAAVDAAAEPPRRHRHPGEQRGHRRGGHGRPTTPTTQWHHVFDVNVVGIVRVTRAALPLPARVGARRDRQHLLDRGDRGPAAARAVLGDQGRGARR